MISKENLTIGNVYNRSDGVLSEDRPGVISIRPGVDYSTVAAYAYLVLWPGAQLKVWNDISVTMYLGDTVKSIMEKLTEATNEISSFHPEDKE